MGQMMSKVFIEAKNLTFHPGQKEKPLFENFSFVFTEQTYFLVGENGCGKSSLAKLLSMTSQQVKHFANIGYLHQIEPPFNGTVAQKIGIDKLFKSLQRMEEGQANEEDFTLLKDYWDINATINKLFKNYNLDINILNDPYNSLSGGMRTRINLLCLEFQRSDFYILDEPSNHLDKKSRQWLDEWITSHPNCLIISHDLTLLSNSQTIIELTLKGPHTFQGGWESYLASKKQLELEAQRLVVQSKRKLKDRQKAEQKSRETIKSKQSKAQKGRSQANQSKIILDKQKETCETTNARLTKMNQKRIEQANNNLAEAKEKLNNSLEQHFNIAPLIDEHNKDIILSNIVLPFGNPNPINFHLLNGQRLWLSGENGSGKSTLLKVILGLIKPKSGNINTPTHIRLLDQYANFLNQNDSALDNFSRLSPGLSEAEYRTRLAQIRLPKESVFQHVSTLSGGETLKVALACLFSGLHSPNMLLLDEPDNHLDLNSKNMLINALKSYKGTIILVCHDEKFVNELGINDIFYL